MNQTKALSLATFIFAAMGGVLYGYDLGIISGALLFVRHDIAMTDDQMSFLVAAVFLGGWCICDANYRPAIRLVRSTSDDFDIKRHFLG